MPDQLRMTWRTHSCVPRSHSYESGIAPTSNAGSLTLSFFVVAIKGSRGYSYRSASTGAIRVALRAGYNVAMKLVKIATAAIQMPSTSRGLNGT